MYKLVITDDKGKTIIVPLGQGEITIGRMEGNSILLPERNVSRFHAKIAYDDDGFVLEDLASLCGTRVKGRLLKGESAAVVEGDEIRIGDYTASIQTGSLTAIQTDSCRSEDGDVVHGKVTPHARLVLLTEPDPGREIVLSGELYVIGRSSETNCPILHATVSRIHARLDCDNGKWNVEDSGSSSGVRVNGIQRDNYELKSGDMIELGSVRLRFIAAGEPYDFEPNRGEDFVSDRDRARTRQALCAKILYAIGAVGVIAVIGLVAVMVRDHLAKAHGKGEQTEMARSDGTESHGRQVEVGDDSGVH